MKMTTKKMKSIIWLFFIFAFFGMCHTTYAEDLANGAVTVTVVQPDGKTLIGGSFTTYNGIDRRHIARLNADGSLDRTTFDPGTGANSTIETIALQSDGKILIGGSFTAYDATPRNFIARLNANGSLDTTFDPGTGASVTVYEITLQPDGKILIAGQFVTYNGTTRDRIARLNANGSLDTTFDPGTGANSIIEAMALQSDGKILIGGYFTTYDGTVRSYIARLNANGSLDTTFDPGTGAANYVRTIVIQPDGKILTGGEFTTFNGTARHYIARLNTSGTVDTTFDSSVGASNAVRALSLQSDGKILIGGEFTTYNGTARNKIARLTSAGALDTTFNPGTGISGTVFATAVQSDGKIFIGGSFSLYNGTARNNIAWINADGSLLIDSIAPVLSNSSPSGSLPAGTTTTTISLRTDENATCKYASTSNVLYADMTNSFATTGEKNHSKDVTGLTNGTSYTYYVRCQDASGNSSIADYQISFSVANTTDVPPAVNGNEVHINTDIDFDGKKKGFDFKAGKKMYVNDSQVTFEGKIPELAGGWVIVSAKGGSDRKATIASDGAWSQKMDLDEDKTITIYIKYYDKNGNEIDSDKYKIRVDVEDPKITDLPVKLTKRPGDKVWWKATDNSEVKSYKYNFRGAKEKTSHNYFHIPKNTPRGTYTLEIRAYDKAGNKGEKTVQIIVR